MQDSVVNYWGTGRRKNAVARVLLRTGSGKLTVNNREIDDYFPRYIWKTQAIEPLRVAGVEGKVDIMINAHGGGLTGHHQEVQR